METDVTSIYSAIDFVHYIDSSEIITQPAIPEEPVRWTDAEIGRMLHIIVRPKFLVFGTAGNCLSFYIMRRTSLKHVSSCFYMAVLAIAASSK